MDTSRSKLAIVALACPVGLLTGAVMIGLGMGYSHVAIVTLGFALVCGLSLIKINSHSMPSDLSASFVPLIAMAATCCIFMFVGATGWFLVLQSR
jgi:hypothetical protein